MKKRFNRMISFALAFTLVCSSVYVPVYAEEANAVEMLQEETQTEPEAEDALQEETQAEPETEDALQEEIQAEPEAEDALQEETQPEPETEDALQAESTVEEPVGGSAGSEAASEEEEELPIPPLNYREIEDEGNYESIREHLLRDELSRDSAAMELPATYNPVKDASYLPVTRDQNPYGSCWAHATLAAAEIGLTKNKGVDPASIDLSELHLAYYMYNTPETDPLGLVQGDKNKLLNENDKVNNFLHIGGNVNLAKIIMQGWIGAASEEGELVYSNAANVIENNKFTGNYAFNDAYHLENYYNVNIQNRDEAKNAILKYGAITASYFADDAYYKNGVKGDGVLSGTSFYNNVDTSTDHAVTIVGWDDTYSKDNFWTPPAHDGAWLVRNSWSTGKANLYSKYRYFWMSYDDTSLTGGVAMVFAPADKYDNNYHYDGSAMSGTYTWPSGILISNVFTVKGGFDYEQLEAVSFDTESSNVKYIARIYTDLDPNLTDPQSGTLAATVEGMTSYGGYYTVPLEKPVVLQKGDTFSVVIELSHEDESDVKVTQELSGTSSWMESVANSNGKESFYKRPGIRSWSDLGSQGRGNLRIKAFTRNVGEGVAAEGLMLNKSDIKMNYSETETVSAVITPDTATSRRVIWSSSDKSVATVSGGVITARGLGTATITATHEKNPALTASCTVHVFHKAELVATSSAFQSDSWTVGDTAMLAVGFLPSSVASNYTLIWSSDNTDVVTVTGNGVITAVGGGTATVTVKAKEEEQVSDSMTIIVSKLANISGAQLSLADDDSGFSVSWKAVTGAHHYKVRLYKGTDFANVLASKDASETACTMQYPLETGETYACGITAYGSDTSLQSAMTAYSFTVAPKYPVTYVLNGGMNHPENPAVLRSENKSFSWKTPTKEGYTFGGWYLDAAFSTRTTSVRNVSEAMTIYAKWSPITYTIRYDGNGYTGGTMLTTQMTYDTAGALRPVGFSKKGYTFQCWNTESNGTGDSYGDRETVCNLTSESRATITLYAMWELSSYTITYELNGGTNAASNPVSYTVEDENMVLLAPEKTGYDFDGWYESASFAGSSVTEVKTSDCVNKTLYAKWSPKKYQVSFDTAGGSSVSAKFVSFGAKYGTLAVPVRSGYTFTGWYTEASGGDKVTADTVMDRLAAHTLYARWSINSYTITFDANGGTVSEISRSVTILDTYGELPTPTYYGYDFVGWYTARTGGTKVSGSSKLPTAANQTLYARWEGKKIEVSFDLNSGSGSANPVVVSFGQPYGNALPVPVKEGYTFTGWYTEREDGDKVTAATVVNVLADQTLYAHWEITVYKVIFDANGGSVAEAFRLVTILDTYGELPVPVYKGHHFVGWYTAKEGGTEISGENMLPSAEDQRIYAHWNAYHYTIAFDGNGADKGAMSDLECVYGQTIKLPANAYIKDGVGFGGWNTEADGTGTKYEDEEDILNISETDNETVILYAQWVKVNYTIHFDGNGAVSGTMDDMDCRYGTEYTLPDNAFSKVGYLFAGWSTEADGTGELYANKERIKNLTLENGKEITLYAVWEGINYTIHFDGNGATGGDPEDMNCVYGTEYVLPDNAFTKDGCIFTGWNTETDGSGIMYEDKAGVQNLSSTDGETVTLYAIWENADPAVCTGSRLQYLKSYISANGTDTADGYEIKYVPETDRGYTIAYNTADDKVVFEGVDLKVQEGALKGDSVTAIEVEDNKKVQDISFVYTSANKDMYFTASAHVSITDIKKDGSDIDFILLDAYPADMVSDYEALLDEFASRAVYFLLINVDDWLCNTFESNITVGNFGFAAYHEPAVSHFWGIRDENGQPKCVLCDAIDENSGDGDSEETPTDDQNWNYDEAKELAWRFTDGTLEIKYNGSLTGKYDSDSLPWEGHIPEIKSLILHEGITEFDFYTTRELAELANVQIPASCTNIDDIRSIFDFNKKLEKIEVASENAAYSSIDGVLYDKSGKKLLFYPRCKPDEVFILPDSCVEIDSIYSLNAKEINLGTSLMTIHEFVGGENVSVIKIPASLQNIKGGVFDVTDKFADIVMADNNPYFCYEDKALLSKDKKKLYQVMPDPANTTYTIPASVEEIVSEAFLSHKTIKNLVVPENVIKIGDGAFAHMRKIEKICLFSVSITFASNPFKDGDTAIFYVPSETVKAVVEKALKQSNISQVNIIIDKSLADQKEDEEVDETDYYSVYEEADRTDIGSCTIGAIKSREYNGLEYMPVPKVTLSADGKTITLVNGRDFRLTYSDNVNAGTARVNVIGIGNYKGQKSADYKITKKSISKLPRVISSIGINDVLAEPILLLDGTKALTKGVDFHYEIDSSKVSKEGTAQITVLARDDSNYEGTLEVSVPVINPGSKIMLRTGDILVNAVNAVYNGKPHKPDVTVSNHELIKGKDYSVTYKNNVKAGTAYVVVTGKGKKCTGKVAATFIISPAKEFAGAAVTVNNNKDLTYNGKLQKPPVTVKINGKKLTANRDYTVRYYRNYLAGEGRAKISGIGNYEGFKTEATFKIRPVALKKKFISIKSSTNYTVKYAGKILVEGTDYTVEISETPNNKAQMTFSGLNNFTGVFIKKNVKK